MRTNLSEFKIKAIKPADKAQKFSDGGGLYIYVSPAGNKLWRYDFRFNGVRKTLSIGKYPAVGLALARKRRDEAEALLALGVDPSRKKQEDKKEQKEAAIVTFADVALEWYQKKSGAWSDRHKIFVNDRIQLDLIPNIGNFEINLLRPKDILACGEKAEKRGSFHIARKTLNIAERICDFARIKGLCEFNAGSNLITALSALPKTQHRASIIDPKRFGDLLRAIDTYDGSIYVKYALKIIPYVFLRSKELRESTWSDINFSTGLWTIPAERMKMRRQHVVPMAQQVVRLLRELFEFTGHQEYLFPSPDIGKNKPITDRTLNMALRLIGFTKKEMCVHGFRGSASTFLNEAGLDPEIIELQLAHQDSNSIRRAYNHSQNLSKRIELMQSWADMVDAFRRGKNEILS